MYYVKCSNQYHARFISGLHSRGGKHIVVNFKGVQIQIQGGQQHIKHRKANGWAKTPPSTPEINPDHGYLLAMFPHENF